MSMQTWNSYFFMNIHKSAHSYRHVMTTAEFFFNNTAVIIPSPPNKNVFFKLKLCKIFLGALRWVISLDALAVGFCTVDCLLCLFLSSLHFVLLSAFCYFKGHTHFSLDPFTAVLPSSCHPPWSSQSSVFYFQIIIKLVIFVIILGICFPPAKWTHSMMNAGSIF